MFSHNEQTQATVYFVVEGSFCSPTYAGLYVLSLTLQYLSMRRTIARYSFSAFSTLPTLFELHLSQYFLRLSCTTLSHLSLMQALSTQKIPREIGILVALVFCENHMPLPAKFEDSCCQPSDSQSFPSVVARHSAWLLFQQLQYS